jgi:hypothetical protein
MIDRAHLNERKVLLKIPRGIFRGIVKRVEHDGLWIEIPDLISPMKTDPTWGALVKEMSAPVVFVPTAQMEFLIVGGSD